MNEHHPGGRPYPILLDIYSNSTGCMAALSGLDKTDDPIIGRVGLVAKYIGQLVYGCNDTRCTERLCRTGYANRTMRPYRDFTQRSARAMAITLCLGPSPSSHVCKFYQPPASGVAATDKSDRDNSSLMQQLCDTPSIRQLGTSSRILIPDQTATREQSQTEYSNDPEPVQEVCVTRVQGHAEDRSSPKPITSSSSEKIASFRAANHFKMSKAHYAARKAHEIRTRYQTNDEDLPEQVYHAEDPYLLLNVSRGNVLRDAFDQLWHRRQSELLRPLRVRLGELDGFDIGHDLGGVQIEFFNLVCRELFSPEAQMFETDNDTGLSYFRPGSLQPLYMFELCGLLFALSIYNGVPLPVDMNLAFYTQLLSSPCQLNADPLGSLRLGWPAIHKSLQAVREYDVDGLYRLFPMEANGLRMEVRPSPKSAVTEGRINIEVFSVTPIVHHSQDPGTRRSETNIDIDSIADAWPGWHLISPQHEAELVTNTNKNQHVIEYAMWTMYGSVDPQRQAFYQGFFSHGIIDLPLLRRCFESAIDLQRYVEGSKHLDIHALRQTTTYEGFTPHSEYVRSFWDIVIQWPEEKQKRLLKFVTASDRIPSIGVSSMKFVIQESSPETSGSLPTSSTCFSTLQLPFYTSPTILAEKLSLAVEYGMEGFGVA